MSDKEFLPVRLSHLLRHCAVGAIVRGPDYLLAVMDISHWVDRTGNVAAEEITYVEQVKSALGITQVLRTPPIAQERDNGSVDGVCVPAVRFPQWMICPHCDLLHKKPWTKLKKNEAAHCIEPDRKRCLNRPKLEQVSWVLVHEYGYLADLPWHTLAHREAVTPQQKQCREDWNESYLYLSNPKTKIRQLRCGRCNARSKFDDRIPINYSKARQQPWPSEPAEETDVLAKIVEVNDARVHSTVSLNALVIPPESRISKGSVVDRVYSTSMLRRRIEKAKNPLARKSVFKTIARELRCTVDDIHDALSEIDNGYPLYGAEITAGLLLESEYQALLTEMPNLADDEDFVTIHFTKDWKSKIEKLDLDTLPAKILHAVSNIVAVSRLKEIMVMAAFQRLNGELVPPDISGNSDWLPALELYGEGVFFSLDEDMISDWEVDPAVIARAAQTRQRYIKATMNDGQSRPNDELEVDARFLLLHTLAHLLIRQLESQAGYPAASLKERIYSAKNNSPMAGILIYVAVPDIVGSLGGLAELAEPQRFLRLISSVFDHAQWCSVDPVCAEHEGQGPNLLNRAACHACSLIPEPSCSYGNVLLDRALIKGDLAGGLPSFLSFQQ